MNSKSISNLELLDYNYVNNKNNSENLINTTDNDFQIQTEETTLSETKSIIINIIANMLFGFSGFQVKLLMLFYPGSYVPNNLLIYRFIGVMLVTIINLKINNRDIPQFSEMKDKFWLFIRCSSNYFSFLFWVLGLNYIRFSTLVCFTATSPVFVLFGAVLILGEQFKMRYLYGLIICILGTFLIVLNDRDNSKSNSEIEDGSEFWRLFFGILFGLGHSTTMALAIIGIKKLSNSKLDNDTQVYFVGLIGVIQGLIFMPFLGGFIQALEFNVNFWCITNGIIFYYAAFYYQYSFKNIDVIKVTTVTYLSIIQAFILGALFLHNTVGFTDIIGSLLVLSYNIYNAYYPA